jgi:predicted RNase H-like nuclease (RuvC/YqgF family)
LKGQIIYKEAQLSSFADSDAELRVKVRELGEELSEAELKASAANLYEGVAEAVLKTRADRLLQEENLAQGLEIRELKTSLEQTKKNLKAMGAQVNRLLNMDPAKQIRLLGEKKVGFFMSVCDLTSVMSI